MPGRGGVPAATLRVHSYHRRHGPCLGEAASRRHPRVYRYLPAEGPLPTQPRFAKAASPSVSSCRMCVADAASLREGGETPPLPRARHPAPHQSIGILSTARNKPWIRSCFAKSTSRLRHFFYGRNFCHFPESFFYKRNFCYICSKFTTWKKHAT